MGKSFPKEYNWPGICEKMKNLTLKIFLKTVTEKRPHKEIEDYIECVQEALN